MSDILNYVCRGLTNSEQRIERLTKCVKNQSATILWLGIGCCLLAKVAAENARDIRVLKSKIKTMEESYKQEGA